MDAEKWNIKLNKEVRLFVISLPICLTIMMSIDMADERFSKNLNEKNNKALKFLVLYASEDLIDKNLKEI